MPFSPLRSRISARVVEVDAVYLSGSLAEGTADEGSDIDLRVVVVDDAYANILALRGELPRTWGPFLFHSAIRESHTVSYFDTLTKIDVFYYRASTIAPSPWLALGTRVLLDRSGRVQRAVNASRPTFVAQPDETREHVCQAIASIVESITRTRRGQSIYGERLATAAIDHLLFADDLVNGRAPFGPSKRERIPGGLTELAQSATVTTIIAALDHFIAESAASCFTTEERRALDRALRQLEVLARVVEDAPR